MSDQTETTPAISMDGTSGTVMAKAKFAKAVEEAKAGASALGAAAREKAGAYGTQVADQAVIKGAELFDGARDLKDQAKEKAGAYADAGKARASDALSGLGKLVSDAAGTIDQALGEKYGDLARGAARSIHETAAKLENKDFGELGEDAREYVRKNPAVAVGMAAVAGFVLARMLRGSDD